MAKKDIIAIAFSSVALLLSTITFWQVQQDRRADRIEEQPRISFSYAPYGVEERYGFSIRNAGNKLARVPRITYTYNDLPVGATQSAELLSKLNLADSGSFRLIAGSSFVIEPSTKKELYTFSESLDLTRQALWSEYSKLLAADICYCDVEFHQCWTKRISRKSRQPVADDFICNAAAYQELMLQGKL